MLTPEQQIVIKMKRRERQLQVLAIFVGLLSAIVMIAFIVRLIDRRLDDERRKREAIERDREEFAKRVAEDVKKDRDALPVVSTRALPASVAISTPASLATPSKPVEQQADQTGASAGAGQPVIPVSGGIQNLDTKKSVIADVLRYFFSAQNIPEMLPLVRDARRVRPLMEDYYSRNPVTPRAWKGVGWAIPVEEPGFRFAYVQAVFEGGATPVNVVVEETDTGFYVDWESTVQYSELGWKDFIASKPGQPKIFRVLASAPKSDGEGGTHAAVLELKHPQEDGVVVGRFDPTDPRFRPLIEQLDLCKWKDVPVILRLCYPGPASQKGEVQIAGVEGKGWLILGDRVRGS